MRLLWRNRWLATPKPCPVPGSNLVEVEATTPVVALAEAHGRRIESPARKVASFALTDGPAATVRKSRAKQAESAYTGDYFLVAILGRVDGEGGDRVVALAPRAVRCANWMLVHPELMRTVPDDFGPDELLLTAAAIRPRVTQLAPTLSQSYLYSGIDPPERLAAALREALASPATAPSPGLESLRPPPPEPEPAAAGERTSALPPLAILGAGDYVRIEVAPALAGASLERAVLCDREPQIAALAASELGFPEVHTDALAAIDSLPRRGLVIVATAHDSHAALAAHALDAGHRVICEKPAVVTAGDLERLTAAATRAPGELELGFNRRHHPLVERVRSLLADESGPTTIVATIREIDIAADHWYFWPNQGTRVAGNLCHWIDLAVHLLGPGPEPTSISVSPRVAPEANGLDAERAFTVGFDDGSVVFLIPTGRGDSIRGVQEQIEVRRGALTVRLDDLWKLRGLRRGRPISGRTLWRDKGHGRMYEAAVRRFASDEPASYPERDIRRVGEIQIAATELLLGRASEGSPAILLARSRERCLASPGSRP